MITTIDTSALIEWLEEESADPCSSELNVFESAEMLVQVAEALRTLTAENERLKVKLAEKQHRVNMASSMTPIRKNPLLRVSLINDYPPR